MNLCWWRVPNIIKIGWCVLKLQLVKLWTFFETLYIIYIFEKNFCLHPSLYLFVSWAWWYWPMTWSTNHRPSVLWHCWLGHVTCKTVSEMTYNVSSGTLNPTIPIPILHYSVQHMLQQLVYEKGQHPFHFKEASKQVEWGLRFNTSRKS